MKTLTAKITATLAIMAIFGIPLLTFAQANPTPGILGIPCGDKETHACGFNDLITLVNRIVHFLIYYIIVPLIAVAFMIVGANFVLNPNKESAKTAAKGQMEMIAYGIFWILAGFLLVKTVLFAFLSDKQITFMKFILDVSK